VLPASAAITAVHNFEVDGKSHPPQQGTLESGGTRLEVSPAQEDTRDYFLHVLRATDSGQTGAPPVTLAEDELGATITIEHAGKTSILRFDKTGPLGGSIRVEESGAVVCEQGLGDEPLPGTSETMSDSSDATVGSDGTESSAGTDGSAGTASTAGTAASDSETSGDTPTSGASAGASEATGATAADSGEHDGDSGCGCRQTQRPAAGAFALLALLGLPRRRPRASLS